VGDRNLTVWFIFQDSPLFYPFLFFPYSFFEKSRGNCKKSERCQAVNMKIGHKKEENHCNGIDGLKSLAFLSLRLSQPSNVHRGGWDLVMAIIVSDNLKTPLRLLFTSPLYL
jgi:hypothetical protein